MSRVRNSAAQLLGQKSRNGSVKEQEAAVKKNIKALKNARQKSGLK